jgi:hypothetical protein
MWENSWKNAGTWELNLGLYFHLFCPSPSTVIKAPYRKSMAREKLHCL